MSEVNQAKYSFFKELKGFWELLGIFQKASLVFGSVSFLYILLS